MAVMTTPLTEFSDKENHRTLVLAGHTASKPQKVIQKRREATGAQVVSEDTVTVVYGTEDSTGAIMPQKVVFEVRVRRPIGALAADVTAAKTLFREIIGSDEFDAVVSGQKYIG